MKSKTRIAIISLFVCVNVLALDPSPPAHVSDPFPAGHKPVMDISGRCLALDRSIRAGDVQGITPGMVYRYGNAFKGKVDGKHYWMVPVRYFKSAPSASIYTQGRIMAEAYACIAHDKVVLWIPKYSQRFGL